MSAGQQTPMSDANTNIMQDQPIQNYYYPQTCKHNKISQPVLKHNDMSVS